jgi:Fur family ferric uptake transcriptional regulator
MKPVKQLEDVRTHGRRVTGQRAIIFEAVRAHKGHLTAEEVYKLARAKNRYINLSTVYRTLDFLKEEGLVTATDLGGGCIQYEACGPHPHHHLICQRCGRVEALDHALLEPLQRTLRKEYEFEARLDHFAIFGLCGRCQKEMASRGSET